MPSSVNTKAPTKQMWRRSVVVLVLVVGLCFSVLIGNLGVIQLGQAAFWQQKAMAQQLSDSVISPNRGSIYDANMQLLAGSAEVGTIIMSPNNIPDDATREKIATDLSAMLGVDHDKLLAQTQKVNSQYEVVIKKIEKPLAQTFIDWVTQNKYAGIFRIITDYKRYYPGGSLASCVLGFVNADNQGAYGLEAEYNDVLAGQPGRIVTAQNGWGEAMPGTLKYESTVDAVQGESLVLTIDQTIQSFAEQNLDAAVKAAGCTNRGVCIVMDVNTGAILAMATKGDFDPNNYQTIADPDLAAQIALLSGDAQSQAIVNAQLAQWQNKAVGDYYEPGSVFKMFTSSMALEDGVCTTAQTFNCPGYFSVDGRTIKCHIYPNGHGTLDLPGAIEASCNPYFAQLGIKIGSSIFKKYYEAFGFTQKTGIDMLGEAPITSSLYHSEPTMTDIELATSAIGQTFKVTPLQIITAMAAVANGGKLMQPYVVSQILDSSGNVVKKTEPVVRRQVLSAQTSATMCAILGANVTDAGGGARNAYVAGYRMAGKTGTADKTELGSDVWASFAGFAPWDRPQVAILMMLDSPQSAVRFGGTIAAPYAQKVMAATLPYLQITPQYTTEELTNLTQNAPHVEGKTLAAAESAIANLGLTRTVVGSGDTVVRQVPPAGTPMPKGGNMVLYTDDNTPTRNATVPDFTGKTLSQANQMAASAGVNILFSGLTSRTDEPHATTQSVPPGTVVPRGTVISVDFVYSDTIA